MGAPYTLHLVTAGLACCAVEVVTAALRDEGYGPLGTAPASGEGRHVLVVSGTVTDRIAPSLVRLYEALPEPRAVISFGACANTGGPYWDSYAVTKGADLLVPVDVYVPGCPPRPELLVAAVRRLHESRFAAAGP